MPRNNRPATEPIIDVPAIVAAARAMVADGMTPAGDAIPAGNHVVINETDGSFIVTPDVTDVVTPAVDVPTAPTSPVAAANARTVDYVSAPAVTVLTPPVAPTWAVGVDTPETFNEKMTAFAITMAAYADAAARVDVYRSVTAVHIDAARDAAVAAARRAFTWLLTARGVPESYVPAIDVRIVAATERPTDVVRTAGERRATAQRTRNATAAVMTGDRARPVGDIGRYTYRGNAHTLTVGVDAAGLPVFTLDAGTPTAAVFPSVSTAAQAVQHMAGGPGNVNGWTVWRWDGLGGRTTESAAHAVNAATDAAVTAATPPAA